jgi:peptidoglycan/LPS O-acetylase OafA/YrhL
VTGEPADDPAILIDAAAVGGGSGRHASRTVSGHYLGQFDSYRVVACVAVVLQHSLLWTVVAGNVVPWTAVMLLHFSRTAFFFLSALVLTYAQTTRPTSDREFWRRRYVQLGVPYLAWTGIYWIYTLASSGGAWRHGASLLLKDLVFGYYQLYFVVVLFQLFLVFPFVLRWLSARRHHARVMAVSGALALLLAADLHFPHAFGPVGGATFRIASVWPWSRNLLTYQEQFLAGMLVALHLDEVRRWVGRWYRQVIATAVGIGVVATLWYLVAVWTGTDTGHASDLYQPIAFVWFTAAVAALECGTWWWYRRTCLGHPPRFRPLSAAELAGLTGGIFFGHVLVLTLLRSGLSGIGLRTHLGWMTTVAVLFVGTLVISGLGVALVLRTRLRWVLGGPVRADQRARLDA